MAERLIRQLLFMQVMQEPVLRREQDCTDVSTTD
jgi:hypothetical protein